MTDNSDVTNLIKEKNSKMEHSIHFFKEQLLKIRTGRASTAILESIKVNSYGQMTPINQVVTLSTPDPMLIAINVWDKQLVKEVVSSIEKANLGLNPQVEGAIIKLHIPPLNEERRKELIKIVKDYAEEAKIAIRSIRRDSMSELKKLEKDSILSEDELNIKSKEVEDLTKLYIEKIDLILSQKEKELLPSNKK